MNNLLYFKHLFRAILKKPLQSILLILIFIVSFSLINTCIHTTSAIDSENANKKYESYGEADLVVSVNSVSPTRFLFESDITNVDSEVSTCGILSMPYVLNKDLVYGAATSFSSVNDIFKLKFISYESFKQSERDNVCFISKSFAEKNKLSLNDSLVLEIYGGQVEYVIKGIAKNDFFAQYEVLVDIRGARKILLSDSVLDYVLPEGVEPYNSIYIKTKNKEESIQLFAERFIEYDVKYADGTYALISTSSLQAFRVIIVSMTFIASIAVILACIYQLSKERYEYSVLFRNCGYTRIRLLMYQILEFILYVFISAGIGYFSSKFLVELAFKTIGFEYSSITFNWLYTFYSFLFIAGLSIITPVIFNLLPKKNIKLRNASLGLKVGLFVGIVVTYILSCVLMATAKFIMTVACMLLILAAIVLCVGSFYRFIAKKMANHSKRVSVQYGLKNVCKVKALTVICNLILILTFCLSISLFALVSSEGALKTFPQYYSAPYVVSGGSNRTYDKLVSNDDFEIHQMSNTNTTYNGKKIDLVCVSDIEAFNDPALVTTLPKNNEVYLSYARACELNLPVGKEVTFTYNGKSKKVVIAGYYKGNIYDVIVDADYFEIPYDKYLVSSKSNCSNEDLYQAITSVLRDEPAVVASTASIQLRLINNNHIYIYFIEIFTFLLVVFSILGIVDNIIGIYKSRKQEFELFRTAGMTKAEVRSMLWIETLYTIVFIIVMGIVVGLLAIVTLRNGLFAFSADCFDSFVNFFKLRRVL